MRAPKVVSHVQPTGRDYSGTTSPHLITRVPTPDEARTWAAEQQMRRVVTVASITRSYRLGLRTTRPTDLTKLTGA